MNIDRVNEPFVHQVAQAIQAGAVQVGTAMAFVNHDVFLQETHTVLTGAFTQLCQLAFDGGLPLLAVRGNPGVDCRAQR